MVTRTAAMTAPISFPVWSSQEHSDLAETVPLTARKTSDQESFRIVTLI